MNDLPDLEKVRERHFEMDIDIGQRAQAQQTRSWLCNCGNRWPCDAIQLAAEVERLRADIDRQEEEMNKFVDQADEVGTLRKEMERLRSEAEGYRLMVCRKACKMNFPVPDGERSPFDENTRYREALEKIASRHHCAGFPTECPEIARAALKPEAKDD